MKFHYLLTRGLPLAMGLWLGTSVCACGSDPAVSPSPSSTERLARQSFPIAGGADDQDDHAVVGIVTNTGSGLLTCTGALIAPNLVVTARHCVAATPEEVRCDSSSFGVGYPSRAFHVTTQWDGVERALSSLKFEGPWFEVRNVWVSTDSKVCGNDLALLELSTNVPSDQAKPLAPRSHDRVMVDEAYRAVGFGAVNDSGEGMGKRRSLDGLRVSCVGNCDPGYHVDSGREWMGQKGICQGDSGGPALDGQGRVAGIVSRGGVACSTPVYSDVHAWLPWIREHALQAATDGNYEAAAWVTATSGGAGGASGAGGAEQGGAGGGFGQQPVRGGFGEGCYDSRNCLSGICIEDDGKKYCSVHCSSKHPDCPEHAGCDLEQQLCLVGAQSSEEETSQEPPNDDDGGCSVAPAVGRTRTAGSWPLWLLIAALGWGAWDRKRRVP